MNRLQVVTPLYEIFLTDHLNLEAIVKGSYFKWSRALNAELLLSLGAASVKRNSSRRESFLSSLASNMKLIVYFHTHTSVYSSKHRSICVLVVIYIWKMDFPVAFF